MIYCVICTRDFSKITPTFNKLLNDLVIQKIKPIVYHKQSSIFEAYSKAVTFQEFNDEDIIIFCHDDIGFFNIKLNEELEKVLADDSVGFVGPAGTTYLGADAIWWDHNFWAMGLHKGCVFHQIKNLLEDKYEKTYYGPNGQVVVLDGLFLAIKYKNIKKIKLQKPDFFEGLWDFYDIYYTLQTHQVGLKNMAIDFNIFHNSRGELAGRTDWHKNREALIKNYKLPIFIKLN